MQVLYVTTFDVESAAASPDAQSTHADAADVCLELLGKWLGGTAGLPVDASQLRSDGDCALPPAYGKRRTAEWTHTGSENVWATRLERRDIDDGTSEAFITRITVGKSPHGVDIRISLARELTGANLTPTAPAELHQPSFVANLVGDRRLVVRADRQRQDGRYLQVRSPNEVAELAASLDSTSRLPILLLHTRTLEAIRAARHAAGKLVGLVRVVTLDLNATRYLHRLLPNVDVPYQGGLLVWPGQDAQPTTVESGLVNSQLKDDLRLYLMTRIAPLSVLTRGDDWLYRRARQEDRSLRARAAAERSAAAARSGSTREEIEALKDERDQALRRAEEAEDAFAEADDQAKALAGEVANLRAKVEQLEVAFLYSAPGELSQTEPSFDDVPPAPTPGDAETLRILAEHLERAAEGRIVFTTNAYAAWRKADQYPTADEMRDSLIKLAKVARDLYDGQDRAMDHVAKWVRENYDLKISLQDDGLSKKWGTFQWEGRSLDRTPHVKVNDGVPPYACGRIYFAFDATNKQIVVDHIGLHA